MFFHEDLNIYKNKNFRSYDFVNSFWNLLESDFLCALGMINTGNITIVVEPDTVYLTVTSNYQHVLHSKHDINFKHSLCLCDDFSVEIDLQIINTTKNFLIDIEKCKLYFQKNKFNDEGIVEFSAVTSANIVDYKKFKNELFINLTKEIQFAINRNIFTLDISGNDFIIAEIDADFEISRAYSFLYNTTHKEAIYKLISEDLIFKQNKDLLIELVDSII